MQPAASRGSPIHTIAADQIGGSGPNLVNGRFGFAVSMNHCNVITSVIFRQNIIPRIMDRSSKGAFAVAVVMTADDKTVSKPEGKQRIFDDLQKSWKTQKRISSHWSAEELGTKFEVTPTLTERRNLTESSVGKCLATNIRHT